MRSLTLGLIAGMALFASPAGATFAIPDVHYPALPATSRDAQGFAPDGWTLEYNLEGDLNADGVADLALVLHQQDPANIVRHDGLGDDPLDTNPRILAVAFSDGDLYRLALENHTLIPRRDNPSQSDPLAEGNVEIARGTLRVMLENFMSAGGWSMWNTTFTFRWQNGRFELIGYDRHEAERNTGETVDVSVNYSIRRMEITRGTFDSDEPGKPVQMKLPKGPLLAVEEIGSGLDFFPDQQ